MLVLKPILATTEIALNQLLQFDPATQDRLKSLTGKIIHLKVIDWNLEFSIIFHEVGVQIESHSSVADCTISGTLPNLTAILSQRGTNSSLFKSSIAINGDIELAEKLRDILRNADIDWEDILARIMGDNIGYQLAKKFRSIGKLAQHTGKTLRQNLIDYCQIEVKYFPTPIEIENLYQKIAELRNDVERAAARVARLYNKKSK